MHGGKNAGMKIVSQPISCALNNNWLMIHLLEKQIGQRQQLSKTKNKCSVATITMAKPE